METLDKADNMLNSGSFGDFDRLIGDVNDPRLQGRQTDKIFFSPFSYSHFQIFLYHYVLLHHYQTYGKSITTTTICHLFDYTPSYTIAIPTSTS